MPSKTPTATDFIPLSEPHLGGNEWTYVKDCLDSGWVSSAGPYVDRFEKETAAFTGSPHAVATVNGTAGLHIALQLAGVRAGELVIVPTLTFVAPVNAIRYCGADPVFMDADPVTWQIDTAKLERFLETECDVRDNLCFHRSTGKIIRAILPVHLLGYACDIQRVLDLAKTHRLKVVEDAAEGLGVRLAGRHVGTWGDFGVLSFNGNKVITTGGGGMILTADASMAKRARYLTTQAKDDELEYWHNEVGYNYRLTNLQAALGVAQLEQLPTFLQKKRTIASFYRETFAELPGISWIEPIPGCVPADWLSTVVLPARVTIAVRRNVIEGLKKAGIGARPLWNPTHELPAFNGCLAYDIRFAPTLHARAISLPSSVSLTPEQLQRVARTFKDLFTELCK